MGEYTKMIMVVIGIVLGLSGTAILCVLWIDLAINGSEEPRIAWEVRNYIGPLAGIGFLGMFHWVCSRSSDTDADRHHEDDNR